MIEAVGASILCLSPYFPDFNPIELWWSQLKSLLRQFSPTSTKMVDRIIRPLAKKIYVIIRGFKFNPLELTHNCKLLTTNYNADHNGDGDSDNDSTIF